MMLRRSARALLVTVGVTLALGSVAGPVGAGRVVPSVSGVASCRADGQYEISWTMVNSLEAGTVVTDAFFVGDIERKVVFSPNPTAPGIGTESHATSVLSGSTSGNVEIAVQIEPVGDPVPITLTATVVLAGDCVAAATTLAPTTTQRVAPATSPRFTG
jgi:hypothetical protein